jgi:RNA polymerase sigma factor (sigma-70 family)
VVADLYNSLRNDRDLMTAAQRIAGDKWEDVVQEIGIVLCSKTEPELEKIQPYFRFWCIRTMTNMMSRTGAIGSKEAMIDRNVDVALLFDGLLDHDPNIDTETATQANAILESLPWYERELFKEYAEQGTLRRVSAATKIPLMSVHRTVKSVKKTIRKKLR